MSSKENKNNTKLERYLSSIGKFKNQDFQTGEKEILTKNENNDEKDCDQTDSIQKVKSPVDRKISKLSRARTFILYTRQWSKTFKWNGSFKQLLLNIVEESDNKNAPFFTVWLMIVQTIFFLVMFSFHPEKHSNLFEQNVTDIIFHQSNSYQLITYSKPGNPYWGPSNEVLIQHGAVFTPCMRQSQKASQELQKARFEENRTGCCLRLEYNTCCQSLPEKCSNRTSHLLRPTPSRSSSTVCGMDPDFCDDDDKASARESISEWKPCRKRKARSAWPQKTEALHMSCKVMARPCTYGIYQQCMFATEEFCTFIRGTYHPEAFLCSQVNPISDICGWFSSGKPDEQPRQYIRLFLSLFMHAGVFQLLISLFFQWRYLRHFEEAIGTVNIMFIYFFSGTMANIASAIFLPVTPEIGPNGANLGTYSFFYYHFIKNWNRYESPWKPFFVNSIYLSIIFTLGATFPWINNFAHITGFSVGLMLMFIISPGKFSDSSRTKSFYISLICLISLFGTLIYGLFFADDISEDTLKIIQHLNCFIGKDWCRIKTDVNIHVKELTVRL